MNGVGVSGPSFRAGDTNRCKRGTSNFRFFARRPLWLNLPTEVLNTRVVQIVRDSLVRGNTLETGLQCGRKEVKLNRRDPEIVSITGRLISPKRNPLPFLVALLSQFGRNFS